MDSMKSIAENLIEGNSDKVAELVTEALSAGEKPMDIISSGLRAGMDVVGQDFRAGNRFMPEVLVAAHAMHAAMDILRPLVVKGETKSLGRFLIGTVQGDIHDIGKNLVAMLLEGAGFEVIDLGVDVSPQKFLDAIIELKPDIVGISALLSTTMLEMKNVIEFIFESGHRNDARIMLGGAPVTEEFTKEIGADGFAPEATSAVEVARSFVLPQ